MERWPSGRRRTLGKRVNGNVSWVRIPFFPMPKSGIFKTTVEIYGGFLLLKSDTGKDLSDLQNQVRWIVTSKQSERL